jgi:hypothetical protein
MDYTTVFRQLIYKDRKDIDEFPVDETDNTDFLTMESVFMEKLEARRFIKDNFNAPELILMIFNNARYITTLIYSENHPQHYLHKYLKIAENDSRDIIMCNHVMPATSVKSSKTRYKVGDFFLFCHYSHFLFVTLYPKR